MAFQNKTVWSIFLIGLLFLVPGLAAVHAAEWAASATTGTWNWGTASNWVPATVPVSATDTVLSFRNTGSGYVSNNDLSSFQAHEIRLRNNTTSSVTFTIQGNPFKLSGLFSQNSSSAFLIQNNITLNGDTTFGGTGPGLATLNGSTTGSGSVAVTFSAGNYLINGTYNNSGGTTVFTGGYPLFGTGSLQNLGNSLTIQSGYRDDTMNLGANTVTVPFLYLKQGNLTVPGTLNVSTALEWTEGAMLGTGTVNALNGVQFKGQTNIAGFNFLQTTLNASGTSTATSTATYGGTLYMEDGGVLHFMSGSLFKPGYFHITGGSTSEVYEGLVKNSGTILMDDPAKVFVLTGTNFENEGTLRIENSSMGLSNCTYTQNSGTIHLDQGSLVLYVKLPLVLKGVLEGTGSISGSSSSFMTIEGLISPGLPVGQLLVHDNMKMAAATKLHVALAGTASGQYSELAVDGTILVDGELEVELREDLGVPVSSTDSFAIVTSLAALTGTFDNAPPNSRITTKDGSGSFLVSYGSKKVTLSDFKRFTAIEFWRKEYFGTMANSGDSADPSDYDQDGVTNLEEYSSGTNPTLASSKSVPLLATAEVGGNTYLTLRFTRIADPALNYEVRASDDLVSWDSEPIWSSTGTANVAGEVTIQDAVAVASRNRRFLKLVISSP